MMPDELRSLIDSWVLSLRAERKSANTIKSYREGMRQFLEWARQCEREPVLDRPTVNAFTAHLVELGHEGGTVRTRQLAVRRFSAWLADEDEIERDELMTLKPPKVDVKAVIPYTEEQLAALFAVCKGKDFLARRDEALARFMAETLTRASEAADMTVSRTDIRGGRAEILRGKGGKGRIVPFGSQTARALDRYVRVRRTHRLAETDQFWLGAGGRTFSYWGLYQALKARAEMAGLPKFHPHRLRHTGATRWLDKKGTEGGLMAVAGWSKRDMIDRYVLATASERAAEEARSLGLGDV